MDATTLSQPVLPRADSSDKALAILCHLSFMIGAGFILPFIVYLVMRKDSEFVEVHSREVLNFHLSLLIYAVCAIPLCLVLIGFAILMAIALLGFICAIIGAFKASDSRFYYYPLTIRLIN